MMILLMFSTLFLTSCRNNNGGLIRIKDNVLSIDLNELNNVKTTIDDFSIIVTDKNNDLNKISEKTQNVIQKLIEIGVIKEDISTEIFDKDLKNVYSKIINNLPFIKTNKEKSKIDLKFGDLEIKVTMNSENK